MDGGGNDNDVVVASWNELNDALFADAFNPKLQRYRSNCAFRGVADERWYLQTSLMRLGGDYVRLEKPILRAFRKCAYRGVGTGDSVWNWLSLGQHHCLPTRLLDWTYSPYVALHFATADVQHMNADAAIWCVDCVRSTDYLPRSLQTCLSQECTSAFTIEMLTQEAATLDQFDSLSDSDFVVFLEPPSLDDRIVNQYALFSVMSNPASRLDLWFKKHPETYRRIIIPAKLKWRFRDMLDQANITERTMLLGLDGIGSWLKRHYSVGPKSEILRETEAGDTE